MTVCKTLSEKKKALPERALSGILAVLPEKYAEAYSRLSERERETVYELRIRAGGLCSFTCADGNVPMSGENGILSSTEAEIEEIVSDMTGGSLYSHAHQLRYGYITYGSARVGIAGSTVIGKDGPDGFGRMTSLNIRIPRSSAGAASEALRVIDENGIDETMGILAVSPPNGGKTTFLRALGASLAGGAYERGRKRAFRLCIADERCEIYRKDDFAGGLADVYSGCPKALAVENATRTLSPEVILLDEIGNKEEAEALMNASSNGVYIAASFHGKSIEDVMAKPFMAELVRLGVFRTAALLFHEGSSFSCRIERF